MASDKNNHVAVWMDFIKNAINDGDQTVIGALVAVVVVFLTIVIFAILKRRGNNRRGVLVLGSCNAGKTLLFTQLVYRKYKQTYTSMAVNSGTYTVPNSGKTVRLIDVGGQERIRMQNLDSNKDLTRAVMFVVDSSTLQKEVKDIAEYLYTVLSDSTIAGICPPVLVVCNKQDLTFSKGASVIQGQLEKEMNTLRVTRSAALQDISSSNNNNTFLGKRNKDFSFADLKPLRVDFLECSAQGKSPEAEPDLAEVEQWLAKIA